MRRFLRWEWLLAVLIVAMSALNTQLSPFFLSPNNLLRASSDFLEIGIMVLPMVLIIISGNIDLSVASTMALAAPSARRPAPWSRRPRGRYCPK